MLYPFNFGMTQAKCHWQSLPPRPPAAGGFWPCQRWRWSPQTWDKPLQEPLDGTSPKTWILLAFIAKEPIGWNCWTTSATKVFRNPKFSKSVFGHRLEIKNPTLIRLGYHQLYYEIGNSLDYPGKRPHIMRCKGHVETKISLQSTLAQDPLLWISVTEMLLCRGHFAWQLKEFVCLGSTISWQAQYFWSVHLKIAKTYWNSEVKCLVHLSFLKEVSQ